MPDNTFTPPTVATDERAERVEDPHTVIVFGAHRLPIAVESIVTQSDGQALQLAQERAASYPDAYGYEMWFNGRKLAAYFSQTALSQNGHTREPAALRHR